MTSQDATRLLGIAQEKSTTLLAMHRLLMAHLPPVLPVGAPGSQFAPCETELSDEARGTVFVFSSMATEGGYPFRQFGRALRGRGLNIVYLKDFEQVWYQRGLLEVTSDRATTAVFLKQRFGHLPRPWTCVGGSAGGHAAIHFALSLGADRAVAFAPQTFIAPMTFQNFRLASAAPTQFDFDDPDNDLQPRVRSGGNTAIFVHYGARNPRDPGHAERLAGLPGIRLIAHPTGTHLIAAMLRDEGRLADAILSPHQVTGMDDRLPAMAGSALASCTQDTES